jgi:putative molybdopterin biosynthesis protein
MGLCCIVWYVIVEFRKLGNSYSKKQPNNMNSTREYLTTAEVAAYLRLKERKVYDLVRQGDIPCVRVTGKLLFPRQAIDLWLMNHLEGDQAGTAQPPLVLAGSQDPLLDWAVRESGSALASLCRGSMDGVSRLVDGRAMMAGLHVLDPASRRYNQPQLVGLGGMRDLVIIHWAARRQGLLVASGNPMDVKGIEDFARRGLRIAFRQSEAGSDTLLRWLLKQHDVDPARLKSAPNPFLTEDDLALAIREGDADVGLAIEAAARRHGLHFIPLHEEKFELALRRRSYFEPAVQRLLEFAHSKRFSERAYGMGGYDVSKLGAVAYNA